MNLLTADIMVVLPGDVLGVIAKFTIHNDSYTALARVSKCLNNAVRTAIEALDVVSATTPCGVITIVVDIGGQQLILTRSHDCEEPDVECIDGMLDYRVCSEDQCMCCQDGLDWNCGSSLTPFLLSVLIHKHTVAAKIIPRFQLRPRWDTPTPPLPPEIWDIIADLLLHRLEYTAFAAVSVEFNKSMRRAICNIPVEVRHGGVDFTLSGMVVTIMSKHHCGTFDAGIKYDDGTVINADFFKCNGKNCEGAPISNKFTHPYDVHLSFPITKMVFNTLAGVYTAIGAVIAAAGK